jgi:guanylate kinase
MSTVKNKIILVGKGGSGKDFLRKKFESRGFEYCVSYTSRPQREGETDGIDYHFVDSDFFENNADKFYELQNFNGWFYGSFIIYINPTLDIITERLKSRNDADSAERRLIADEKDFSDFVDYDVTIRNEDF